MCRFAYLFMIAYVHPWGGTRHCHESGSDKMLLVRLVVGRGSVPYKATCCMGVRGGQALRFTLNIGIWIRTADHLSNARFPQTTATTTTMTYCNMQHRKRQPRALEKTVRRFRGPKWGPKWDRMVWTEICVAIHWVP